MSFATALYTHYFKSKWERNQPKPKSLLLTRKPEEEESRPSPSTSTRSSSKCTPISESQRRPWTSWTPSSMIPSTELPLKDPSLLDSTREELFHPERSNQLSSSSSPENSPDTLSQKELKPLLNISNNDDLLIFVMHLLLPSSFL